MTKNSTYQGHAFGIAAAIMILAIVLLAGVASADPIQINISITNKNNINIQGNGDINVDILSSPDFIAPARVNISTVTFMGAPWFGTPNIDNKTNTISLKFHVQNTVIQCVDLRGYLFGTTYDGQTIYGSDIIHINAPASQSCTFGTGPNITFFDPPYSPVMNNVSESRNFSIKVNQTVNVFWFIGYNGNQIQADGFVNESTYTNNSAIFGGWNVIVYANNSNGSDVQSWGWIVTQVNTNISVTSSPNPSASGQPVTFTATVDRAVSGTAPGAGTPTGTVKFFNGSTLLGTVPLSGLTASLTNSSLGIGSNSITAVYSGDNNFSTSTSPAITQTVVKVNKATPTISWSNPADITYGTALNSTQLNASASYNGSTVPGNFTYSPSNSTVLSAGMHILQANFTPTDTMNYTNASKNVTINISKADQTITWSNPADIVYGTALSDTQLNAVVTAIGPAPAGALTYAPPAGTILSAGDGQTLSVTAAATDNYTEANDTVTINVTKASQTITFGALGNKTYGDAPFDVSATASSGLPVSFTASGECTVSGNNVTITGAGICTITANQSGNANYIPAPDLSQSFNIVEASQTITFNALADKTYGDTPFMVNATASSGLPVSFTASGTCTISDSTVTITGAGTCTITAHQAGDANYNAAPEVPQTFSIAKATAFITVTPYSVTYDGNAHTATAIATGAKVEDLSADVDLSGTTHTNAGDYLSDAWTFTDTTGNYNDESGTVHDAISKADPIINFDPLSDKTYGDTPFDVSATATSGLPVSFTASGTCTVSGSTVTITGAGSCTITASQAGNDDYNAATPVSQAFNIIKAQLTITADNASRAYGDANPALTGTIVGIKNSDGITATYSTLAVMTSPVGDYAIVPASVDSDPSTMGNYNVTLVNGNLTITKAETTTSLSSSINPSVSGQSVNFTATMSTVAPGAGIPNGTMQFKIDGSNFGSPVELSNGSATSIGNSSLSVGTHTINAEYSGDGNFNSSTSLALTQTVNKASNNIPTTTTTSSSAGGSTGNSGCGSGVISKENFSNIKQYETREVNVHISEGATVFRFATLGIVNESGFTAKTNEGCIAARGEVLKERPSQAASDAPGTGTVYFNIWLGPWGYGESSKIENPYVVFSVPDEKNNESVKLMMYKNNSWIDLKTEKIDTGAYRAYTGGFGSFAIVKTAPPDETPSETSTSPAPTPLVITNGRVPQKPTNLSLILVVLILMASILIGYRRYRKGLSRKKVNPQK